MTYETDAMTDPDHYALSFEQHRPHLQAIAYRMLGSVGDAEDAVQEAWLRLSRSDAAAVTNVGGWLTTVVGRICIDMLRARRTRNEEYVGTWIPEPVVSDDDATNPAQQAELGNLWLKTVSPSSPYYQQVVGLLGQGQKSASQLGQTLPEDASM